MNTKYLIIAPILYPKLCKDYNVEKIDRYSIIWSRQTNELIVELTTPSKTIKNHKKDDNLESKLNTFPLNKVVESIKKEEPAAETIFCTINFSQKRIEVSYFDKDQKHLRTKTL